MHITWDNLLLLVKIKSSNYPASDDKNIIHSNVDKDKQRDQLNFQGGVLLLVAVLVSARNTYIS